MKNIIKLLGIAVFVAVIGFTMIACGGGGGSSDPSTTGSGAGELRWITYSGTSGDSNHNRLVLEIGYGIKDPSADKKTGFTITADGEPQTISTVYADGDDRVEIFFGDKPFTSSTVIKLSYDGTGPIQLDAFSNKTATYDSSMNH